MPFAGYIYSHPGMTNSEFNRSNIAYCMREVLRDILGEILLPFEYIAKLIQSIHLSNFNFLNFLRRIFSDIRNLLGGIFTLFYNLLANLIASINNIIIYLSDAFIKSVTIPLVIIYAANIVIYCLRILAKRLLTWIITILAVVGLIITVTFIAIFLAVFFSVSLIPIVGEVLAPILATSTAMAVASVFLVTYIIIAVIYGEIAHVLMLSLDITYEEAPPPPKLRAPNV
jgi:hypothetical protein